MESCYANEYKTPVVNFLQYNAWGQLDEIDIPYHSCGEKILKYEIEGRTIKFPNVHFFPQFCFVELEKWPIDPFIYTVKTGFTPEVTPRKSRVEFGWDLASSYVVCPCLHAQWSRILGLVKGGDKDLSQGVNKPVRVGPSRLLEWEE